MSSYSTDEFPPDQIRSDHTEAAVKARKDETILQSSSQRQYFPGLEASGSLGSLGKGDNVANPVDVCGLSVCF